VIAISSSAQSYFLNGDAQASAGDCYTLTPNVPWQNGTVWYAEQLNLNEPFTLEFEMNFGSNDATGADGMVFVLQTVGTNAIGSAGGGMGFEGFNPSFGIEFDTYTNNTTGDPTADHVAFLKNGNNNHNSFNNLAGPVQASSTSANIENGQNHVVKITWNPQTQFVELFFDCVLRISDQNDLINNIFGGNANVYWGFTGATGGEFNLQTVCLQDYFYDEMNDSTICAGQSITLAAPGNPQGDFVWTPADGLDDPFAQTPVATPDATTQYCFTYTDLCGNDFSNCHTVFVEAPPVIDAGEDAAFCAGENLQLTATCDQPEALLQWSSAGGSFAGGTATLTPVVNSAGTYVLEALSPVAGCAATDEVEITEIPLPVFIPDSPQQFCPGGAVLLDAGDGWDAVLWFDGSAQQTIEVNAEGTYEATVTLNGCSSSAEFDVTEVDLPAIDLGPDEEICAGETVVFTAVEGGIWSTGATEQEIVVTDAGTYFFVFENSGCTVSDTAEVLVTPPPQFDLGPDQFICSGDTIVLQIPFSGTWSTGDNGESIAVSAGGVYQVIVTDGPCTVTDAVTVTMLELPSVDLGDDPVYCNGAIYTIGSEDENVLEFIWSTGDETPTIDIRTSGDYFITVYNSCGEASDTLTVLFEECDYSIYIPTAFTPDGDGLNDVLFAYTNNLIKPELNIYNRWGVLIFSTNDLTIPWVGDVQGGAYYAPDGVYTWQLKFLTDKGDAGEVRGHVMVMR
jgi:gliding motility-associated-like protein